MKVANPSYKMIMMSLCTGSSSSTQWQNIEDKTWKRAYGALVKEAADKVKTTNSWIENCFEREKKLSVTGKLHCRKSFATLLWVSMSCLGCTRCFLSKVRGGKRWKKRESPLGGWEGAGSHTLAVADKKGVKCLNRGRHIRLRCLNGPTHRFTTTASATLSWESFEAD